MLLHKIHLDLRCREVRRDLADPYEMHATLCRAFSEPEQKCPEGAFLWRLEPENDSEGCPQVLVQSPSLPDWPRIGIKGWFAREPDHAVNLTEKLKLDSLRTGQRFRFRLRANPCVTRQGKRLGLLRLVEQESWLERRGREQSGFSLPHLSPFDLEESSLKRVDVRVSQEQRLQGKQHSGNDIVVFSVLYDGFLTVTDSGKFRKTLQSGIGHGKTMGLGLLSVVPVS